MPFVEPALAVAQKLAAAGLGLTLANGVSTTANLFASDLLPAEPASGVPHAAVFVRTSGGPPPVPYMGTPATRGSHWAPAVQVVVRGDVDQPETSEELARDIIVALHRADLSASGYFSCLARQSTPTNAGPDPTGHPVFTLNVELWYKA